MSQHRFQIFLILLLSLLAGGSIQARVVNDAQDLQRLLGWDAQQRLNQQFEKERLSDVGRVDKKRKEFNKEQEEDLKEYRKWKSRQKASLDETSPEYKRDLNLKVEEWLKHDRERTDFVKRRNVERRKAQAEISLTEATELGLDHGRERADWDQRYQSWAGAGGSSRPSGNGSGNGGSRGSSFGGSRGGGSNSDRSDYIPPEFDAPPPPPPMAPPAEFFEPEVPPPPPIEEGEPGMDEAPIPPVIEDDF